MLTLARPQAELKTGETYRGELHEAEDNWNVQIKNCTSTAKVLDIQYLR